MRHGALRYIGVMGLFFCSTAWALDGATSLEITPANSWRALEIYTGGNTLSNALATSDYRTNYAGKGKWDGTDAYALDSNTVRVLFNHEVNPAAISNIDLNRTAIRNWIAAGTALAPSSAVTHVGLAYDSIVGSTSITNFCASSLFEANRFGANKGAASRFYITGEETSGGSLYAIDLDSTATNSYRKMYELTNLPTGRWEQAIQFDTGRTDKIGLLLFEDGGYVNATTPGTPLRMWIGNKRDVDNNGTLSFLEKNGLSEGTTYYWSPGGVTAAGSRFESGDNPVTGAWSTAVDSNTMLFSKLEDAHLSPTSGTTAAFNSEDRGTFSLSLSLTFNANGTLNAAAITSTVKLLLEERRDGGPLSGFNNQDNLTWSTATKLFTQEDGDTTKNIWQIDPTSLAANLDAVSIATVTGGAGESSGIVDVSALFGYVAGSLLLTNSHSTTLADNQMVLLISPNAQLVPEPTSSLAILGIGFGLLARRRCARSRPAIDLA